MAYPIAPQRGHPIGSIMTYRLSNAHRDTAHYRMVCYGNGPWGAQWDYKTHGATIIPWGIPYNCGRAIYVSVSHGSCHGISRYDPWHLPAHDTSHGTWMYHSASHGTAHGTWTYHSTTHGTTKGTCMYHSTSHGTAKGTLRMPYGIAHDAVRRPCNRRYTPVA